MNKTVGKILIAFLALVIGIGLLVSISGEEQTKTTRTVVTDELFDISSARADTGEVNESLTASNRTVTYAPTGWKTSDTDNSCNQIQNVVYGNASTNFVLDTDYKVYATSGIIHVMASANTNGSVNETYIDYTYCGDDYLTSAWTRTVLNTVPGLFAIALLLLSVGLFYSIAKDNGVI